jgi:hypothetical protein
LLVPFATGVGVAGQWSVPVAFLLVSILSFYVARTSWLKRQWKWVAVLLAGSAAAAVPLLVVWQLWWLIGFAACAAPLAGRPTGRTVREQLIGMAGLTLTAPAAWYVATGNLDATAWRLWLLNVAYFAGGVFYVRMHLNAAKKLPGCRTGNLVYHAALAVLLLALGCWGVVAWPVTLAFAPLVVRAFVGAARLSPVLRIKRLGWTEVAHSVAFAVLLIGLWER